MSTVSQLAEAFDNIIESQTNGVVGLVDELLRLCQDQGLDLNWEAGFCRIRSHDGTSESAVDRPLRKSVFRAMLARLATICNQQNPNSVSPYGGEGQLSLGTTPPILLRLSFANTTDAQWVSLRPQPQQAA